MTRWQQWDGSGLPTEKLDAIVYFYPGRVDIEDAELREALVAEIHMDGVTPDKRTAHGVLENAIVIHGQVEDLHGELSVYTHDASNDYSHHPYDATWVELDEYVE